MNVTKSKLALVCLTGLSLGMPAAVYAGADSGFYLGAGVGDATVKDSDANFDASDSAYKVFGGYNIGYIPLVDFAVEASYIDFGSPSTSAGSIDVTGVDAFGLAGLSFGPFGIFAKAGVINWDSDATFGTLSSSDSGSDPAYGVGARFAIGPFSVRAEYEYFDVQSGIDMVSVSGVFTF
jgi:outer membrane immunogenic protein